MANVFSHNSDIPGAEDIIKVRKIIAPCIHKTPVLTSQTFNQILGASLFFKCENFQKGGAFKFRGASHAVMTLSNADAELGVCTHSSGNHAQALALAANMRGIKAHIVMPENAPEIKVDAVKGYGGDITFCMPTLQAREATLQKVIERTGAIEIHPYNDYRIIAGQATACAELLEEIKDLDIVIAPVGGGGLLSGTILSARYFAPKVKVMAGEPLQANDAWQSFKNKKFIPSQNPQTIADGLRTSLGSLTYPIILNGVEDILTASEETIVSTMKLIWERMKIIVEPSGVLPLAVMFENKDMFAGKRVGLILSGGNTDLFRLPWLNDTSFSKR
ncbi:MAG: pyridoxal-phosphate dependent enzyme [Bacteroides sp.]|jgi:threonine dehydratase|nr:pyridoxal-phosphate dependent enzyme [Bacteroides sp.]